MLFWLGLTSVAVEAQQLPQSPDAPGVITASSPTAQGNRWLALRSAYTDRAKGSHTITTDASGAYRIGLLAAGIYQLAFHDPNEQYALQFYGGARLFRQQPPRLSWRARWSRLRRSGLAIGSRITGTIADRTGIPLGQLGVRGFIKAQNEWHLVAEKWLVRGSPNVQPGRVAGWDFSPVRH